jgi:arginine exporter protein ArgO
MRNPFPKMPSSSRPASRLDRLVDTLLLSAAVAGIAALLAPGLFGVLVKASARTVGFLLVFLMAARAVSARIGELFGKSR